MATITMGPDGGQVPLIKTASYDKLVSLGEGAAAYEFWMLFRGPSKDNGNKFGNKDNFSRYADGVGGSFANLKFLVQATQLPPLQRENIETYGPQGVQFNQQGRFKNAQDIPITFKEVIKGVAYATIRDWVAKKHYLSVELHISGESYRDAKPGLFLLMENCWLELDGVDLNVEDAAIIKPSGTLHANWCHWCQILSTEDMSKTPISIPKEQ